MIFGIPNMEHIGINELAPCMGVFFEHTIFLNKENVLYMLEKNGFQIIEIIDYENHSTIYRTKKHDKNINHTNHICIQNYSELFIQTINKWITFIETCTFDDSHNIFVFGASYNTQYLLTLGLNKMKLKVRQIEISDWDMLVEWWNSWKDWGIGPSKETLPLNGTGGLIVESNGVPIIAGFLYLTNSKVAWLEWIVSDPEYKNNNKKEAIELLIKSLEDVARNAKAEIILSVGRNKSLLNIHEGLGYTVDKNPSHEISKNIKLWQQ
jgi:hypothetical protein